MSASARRGRAGGGALRIYASVLATGAAAAGLLAFVCIRLLGEGGLPGAPTDPDALLRWFHRIDAAHGVLKWAVPAVLLAAADAVVVRRRLRRGKAAAFLWSPAALFLVFAVLHWGFVGDAFLRFHVRKGLWGGGFNGALIRLGLAAPLVLAVTMVNHGVVFWVARRRRR